MTEYEMFRLKKMQNSYEEDNMSAHYSNKESYPQHSDRPQTNSARSSPEQIVDQLQMQLNLQRKQYSQLSHKYSTLEEEHKKLQAKFSIMEERLKKSEEEKESIRQQLEKKMEREKGTKGKLREWVNLAKQNLNQF